MNVLFCRTNIRLTLSILTHAAALPCAQVYGVWPVFPQLQQTGYISLKQQSFINKVHFVGLVVHFLNQQSEL